MVIPESLPKRSYIFVVGAVALLLVLGLLGFYQYQKISLEGVKEANKKLEETFREAAPAEKPQSKANLLQAKLRELEHKQILWADAVLRIEKTIPKIKDSGEPLVLLRSYSGASDGKLILNVSTRENAFDPLSDVALLIRSFRTDASFKDIFVPVITKTVTSKGSAVLSFSLNAKYQP